MPMQAVRLGVETGANAPQKFLVAIYNFLKNGEEKNSEFKNMVIFTHLIEMSFALLSFYWFAPPPKVKYVAHGATVCAHV